MDSSQPPHEPAPESDPAAGAGPVPPRWDADAAAGADHSSAEPEPTAPLTGSSWDTQAGAAAGGGETSGAAAGGGTALAKTADIPEGGGKIFKEQGVVVTQPTAGTYKAFSAKCTHQGCAVSSVTDGVIVCPCHNSRFSVADGSVKKGPATRGLPEEKITVSGDSITLS